MRPKPILWFELLYLGSLALVAIRVVLTWSDQVADFGTGLAATVVLILLLLPLLLVPLVSRRRSQVAKALLMLIFALTLAAYLPVLLLYGAIPKVDLEQVLVWALQGTGLILLFMPSARAWLARKDAPPATTEALGRTFE